MRYCNRNKNTIDTRPLVSIQEETGCGPIMSELLFARQIMSSKQFQTYTNPPLPTEDDPFMLSDMKDAVAAIMDAMEKNKRICIYGDYDVDGVCATVILYKTIRKYTNNLTWYIPSRQKEGFGMNESSIKKLAKEKIDLIITVDNGISAVNEADLVYSLGMQLIITDHHRFTGKLPQAEAIVASSRNNYASSVNDLSGAGIAWMLSRAITGAPLTEYLPYVALAVAADSVKVTNYNRAYLINAFKRFYQDEHFKALLRNAGSDDSPVSMYTLNYILAPRINAAGRMAHADLAVRFFLSEEKRDIKKIGNELEVLNQKRKEEENRIYNECINNNKDTDKDVLVFYGENWNTGVVGIVASRLSEAYRKNVFVLGRNSEGEYVGSGRSNSVTDLYTMLLPCADTMKRFGGHSGAAGITVREDKLVDFINAVNISYINLNPNGTPTHIEEYDLEIQTNECTVDLVKEIEKLAPFGPGNPEPVFRFSNSIVSEVRQIGKNHEHISALISNNSFHNKNDRMRIVAFKHGYEYDKWYQNRTADILASLSINSFQNIERCEGRCVAFNGELLQSEGSEFLELVNAFSTQLQYNNKDLVRIAEKISIQIGHPYMDDDRLRELYLYLRYRYQGRTCNQAIKTTGTAEELAAMLIFYELGLVKYVGKTVVFNNLQKKTNCHSSVLFSVLNKKQIGGNDNGT